jgi:hypothetical protein
MPTRAVFGPSFGSLVYLPMVSRFLQWKERKGERKKEEQRYIEQDSQCPDAFPCYRENEQK